MKAVAHLLLWILAAAAVVGCGSHTIPETPKPPEPPPIDLEPATVFVGTARADLTVPPGPATYGHGPDARVAEGFWTRNYCRVFYFRSATNQRLALVPCDLPAMSLLLQRHVAAKAENVIHASELMMTATHTHAGVGHFFGASQYTGIFSSRTPGYDDELVLLLAERIAKAVRDAAKMAETQHARLRWSHRDDFWCFTRNRSLAAYRLNRPPFAPAPRPCTKGLPELAAIDPAIDVLKIDAYDPSAPEKDLGPIGSISFLAMHPTVIKNTNRLFGADVFGLVSRYVEEKLRRESCRDRGRSCDPNADPLHAVVNTNEGDISPIWSRGDIEEAIEIGTKLADFVWKAHPPDDAKAQTKSVVLSRYIEDKVRGATFTEGGQRFKTCPYPELGQGAARGGTDHPTSVAPLPMFGSDRALDYDDSDCHSPKSPLLGPLSCLTRPAGVFPATLPLAVAVLGDSMIAFVPAELTVTAGNRLKTRMKSMLAGFDKAPSRMILAGLANEYIQYVATAEEYELQDYEGASTLFGPNSSNYLSNRFGLLAGSLYDPRAERELKNLGLTPGHADDVEFEFGPALDTGIHDGDGDYEREHLGTCVMPQPVHSQEPPRFCVYWRDGGPGDVAPQLYEAPWVSVVADKTPRRRVRLCLPDAQNGCDPWGYVDDRGLQFRTRIHEEVGPGWVWSTLFAPSAETWAELRERSVRILVAGSPAIESQSFSKDCMPARCTTRQARLCTVGVQNDDWEGLVPEKP